MTSQLRYYVKEITEEGLIKDITVKVYGDDESIFSGDGYDSIERAQNAILEQEMHGAIIITVVELSDKY